MGQFADAMRQLSRAGLSPELEAAHQGRSIVTRVDQLIYSELDPLTEIYLLTSGMVRLFTGEAPSMRTSLLLAAPALFADRDVLAACSVSQESARSVSKSQLLCFDREEVEASFANDDDVRRTLTVDLLQRYARTVRFSSYLALPLEQRLAWLLYEHAGKPAESDGRGELPTYDSLALMTDSSEKSVGRAMRTLQESGALAVDAGRRFELAPATCEEMASSGMMGLFHRIAR